MKKIILLFLSISLMMTACKKPKSENDDDNADVSGLIASISISGIPVIEFSYNSNAKLKTKTIHQGTSELIITYEYTGNKVSSETAKQNSNIVYKYTYEYNNNEQLIRVNIVGANDTYWEMHYDNNGKINEAVQYISGGESKKQEYTYNGDNLVEAALYFRFGGVWELQERNEFEYDNLHNPLYDLNLPFSEVASEFAGIVSPNNTLREKDYDQNNILTDDMPYQITYNADHYPLQVVDVNAQLTFDFLYY